MAGGEKTVVLRCEDESSFAAIQAAAHAKALPCHVVTDAGRTEVDPGTATCLAIGPQRPAAIDEVTGELHLLR